MDTAFLVFEAFFPFLLFGVTATAWSWVCFTTENDDRVRGFTK
jgi:hypothetical protein